MKKQESRHETTIEFYRKELQERSKLLENQQVLALESNKKDSKIRKSIRKRKNTLIIPLIHLLTLDKTLMHKKKTYTTNPVNINRDQEETKETEIQYKDISGSQSDESTQGEEAKKRRRSS